MFCELVEWFVSLPENCAVTSGLASNWSPGVHVVMLGIVSSVVSLLTDPIS